jgi:ABC-type Zn2+ transport system substrate-binding protein/surface adhesin
MRTQKTATTIKLKPMDPTTITPTIPEEDSEEEDEEDLEEEEEDEGEEEHEEVSSPVEAEEEHPVDQVIEEDSTTTRTPMKPRETTITTIIITNKLIDLPEEDSTEDPKERINQITELNPKQPCSSPISPSP